MNFLTRRVTKKMLIQLRRGRAIELSKTEKNICSPDDYKGSLPRLYSRGLIDIKMVMQDDEEILCVYITRSGIDFLNKCQENDNKLGSKYSLF